MFKFSKKVKFISLVLSFTLFFSALYAYAYVGNTVEDIGAIDTSSEEQFIKENNDLDNIDHLGDIGNLSSETNDVSEDQPNTDASEGKPNTDALDEHSNSLLDSDVAEKLLNSLPDSNAEESFNTNETLIQDASNEVDEFINNIEASANNFYEIDTFDGIYADDSISDLCEGLNDESSGFQGISPLAAINLPDEDKHDLLPGYEYSYNAADAHDKKYFAIYKPETMTYFAEGIIGGDSTFIAPLIPDNGPVRLEFLTEQTQEIRLELWENNDGIPGNYLGLISCGIAEGQWGIQGGEQWHNHDTEEGAIIPVANYLTWDGQYWNKNYQMMMLIGSEIDDPVPGLYNYYIRF